MLIAGWGILFLYKLTPLPGEGEEQGQRVKVNREQYT
jgi:hypothetical protein